MSAQPDIAAALDALLEEAEELALEDERELWKGSYIAVLRSGGDSKCALQESDAAVRIYRQRFGARALAARQRRCAHEFGPAGTCVLCGIDVAHDRAGITTPAPAPAVIEVSSCICAIPTNPPHDHNPQCPVYAPSDGAGGLPMRV